MEIKRVGDAAWDKATEAEKDTFIRNCSQWLKNETISIVKQVVG